MKRLAGIFSLISLSTTAMANLPYYPMQFPRDEGAHHEDVPYKFDQMLEWWYFNSIAQTDEGNQIGFSNMITNKTIKSDGKVITIPIMHLQVNDIDNKKTYGVQKIYQTSNKSFSTRGLDIRVENDYQLKKTTISGEDAYVLKASGQSKDTSISFDLVMKPTMKPWLIDGNGLVQMAENTNSYYYSMPKFVTTGTVTLNGKTYHITKKPGTSWMDRQWGDFNVHPFGWEWFSLRLENGMVGNIFAIIDTRNHQIFGGAANIIFPNGETKIIPYKNIKVSRTNYWHDDHNGLDYPTAFSVDIPEAQLSFTNTAAYPEQEVNGYWEGYTHVAATYKGKPVKGFTYTQLMY